jgi:hypothetical protein
MSALAIWNFLERRVLGGERVTVAMEVMMYPQNIALA